MTENVRKKSLSANQRRIRGLLSLVDPRAYLHMLKIVNYYNYTHVQPLREMKLGPAPSISPDASFANAERIEIGARARVGSRSHLWAGPSRGRIVIGDDLLMGPEVMITAANYRYNDGAPVTEQPMDEADVIIGSDVWLGTRAVVMPGVTIGDGSVIGAGAVVTRDIPPMSVAVGTPAKVVAQRDAGGAGNG